MSNMTKNSASEAVKVAIARELAEQPEFYRRKDSLTVLAGAILQVAQMTTVVAADAPVWVMGIVAVVITIAQIVIIAGTPGAVTPSMEKRLVEKVADIDQAESVREKQDSAEKSYQEILNSRYGGDGHAKNPE